MVSVRQKIICLILAAAALSVNIAIVLLSGSSTQYEISVGQVCPEDIYAPRGITDSVTTAARKKAASDAVSDIYVTDADLTAAAVDASRDFIASLYAVTEDDTVTDKAHMLSVNSKLDLDYSIYERAVLLSASQYEDLSRVSSYIEDVMSRGVTDTDAAVSEITALYTESGASDAVLRIAAAISKCVITLNKKLDAEATQAARKAASDLVSDVTYMKNQIIVRRGEILSEAQYTMLSELGFIKGTSSFDIFHTVSAVALIIAAAFLVVIYYITVAKHKIAASPVTVSAICAIISVGGAGLIYSSHFANVYLMPLSVCPALAALLTSPDLSVVLNLSIALTCAIYTGDFSAGLVLALAGCGASVFFSRVTRRAQLLPATVFTSLAYALIWTFSFTETTKDVFGIIPIAIQAFLGALLGGILAIGTIPFWETIFDVITPMKLGELSNPEHKLLKKLLLKAPGSYHHSLTVANMADAAASAIGANALLARVGAYYHDIGKISNPMYFKENQITTINPHDALPPEESAKIIISHVKDGAALADAYHLPSVVKDIILQHHGTTTVSYFLYKAQENKKDVDESIFTYPGPAPRTKEATIIMLADACEAAVRAVREKGDADARAIVESIISSRIAASQLSGSSLTFEDLEKVKESFIETLGQYFHKRIIYPQNKEFTKDKEENE